jgi:hypothetical protein
METDEDGMKMESFHHQLRFIVDFLRGSGSLTACPLSATAMV